MGHAISFNYYNSKIDNIGIVKGEFIKKEISELISDNLKETLTC